MESLLPIILAILIPFLWVLGYITGMSKGAMEERKRLEERAKRHQGYLFAEEIRNGWDGQENVGERTKQRVRWKVEREEKSS
jgi:hypothetical protein